MSSFSQRALTSTCTSHDFLKGKMRSFFYNFVHTKIIPLHILGEERRKGLREKGGKYEKRQKKREEGEKERREEGGKEKGSGIPAIMYPQEVFSLLTCYTANNHLYFGLIRAWCTLAHKCSVLIIYRAQEDYSATNPAGRQRESLSSPCIELPWVAQLLKSSVKSRRGCS